MTQVEMDVYVICSSNLAGQDKIEVVRCRAASKYAVVVKLTWHATHALLPWKGVGHYEVVTYNSVMTLPRQLPFLAHLDALHSTYLTSSKKREKWARRGAWKPTMENEVDLTESG